MQSVADVKCYYCGFVSGELSAPLGAPLASGAFTPTPSCQAAGCVHAGKLRCPRCEGPVYLDDIRKVRPRIQLTISDLKPKRGRPRRTPEELPKAS